MNISKQCYILLAGLLALASPCVATTYYVAKTGSDSQAGTASQPFLTIQKGIDAAQPGDRIVVGSGVYAETATTVRNGSPGNYITLDGQGQATVHRVIISQSHFRVQNITISGYDKVYGSMLWLRRGGHSAMVSNVVVDANEAVDVVGIAWESPSSTPFGSDAASDCVVVDSRVTGILGSTAISIYGEDNLVENNLIHDVGQADFLRLWGRDNIIRGNTFTNNFVVEGIGNHIDFVQTFGNNEYGSWGHIIEKNKIIDVEGGQLSQLEGNVVPEIGNWTLRNNLFMDIALHASCSIPQMKYYNNVFYRCNYFNGSHALNFGSRTYDDASRHHTLGVNRANGLRLYNNVFLACGDERQTRGWYAIGEELTDVLTDHNFVAKADFGPVKVGTKLVGSGQHDNSEFRETHGINGGNPEFFNAIAGDFRISDTSLLVDAGTLAAGVPDDMIGTVRPQGQGVDIGFIEYGDGSAPPPLLPVPNPPVNVRRLSQ